MAEKKKVGNLDLGSIDDMITLSQDIAKFVKERNLSTEMQGKQFVQVEAWMYAGSRLGLTSYTEELVDKSNAEHIQYQAKVKVVDIETGAIRGQGFGFCSNKERNKRYYEEYAIASMAQTRGAGKAYRMFLAQLMRMAGFEPTPAEELEWEGETPAKAPAKAKAKAQEPTEEQKPLAGPITPVQKKKLVELLNNELITVEERTKMLPKLDAMDTDRAATATLKLKETIRGREAELQEQAGN